MFTTTIEEKKEDDEARQRADGDNKISRYDDDVSYGVLFKTLQYV